MVKNIELKTKFFEGINFVQRVKNFSLRPTGPEIALLPLFEAIANSYHSIEESGREDGQITVRIERVEETLSFGDNLENLPKYEPSKSPINGFTVEDNGIGFDNIRFNAFVEADTDYRASLGGKGIGRYSWLKAFKVVSINSIYNDDSIGFMQRTFDFRHTSEAIHKLETNPSEDTDTKTIIRLIGYYPSFSEKAPKTAETIARRVIEHFLFFFLNGKVPGIRIIDAQEEEKISLNDLFSSGIKADFDVKEFKVKKFKFYLRHVKLYSASESSDHRMHLCGGGREVIPFNLSSRVNGIKSKNRIQEEDRAFIYLCYVNGKYLDEHLNPERTDFLIPEKPAPLFEEIISKDEIIEKALNFVKAFLNDHLTKVSRENEKKIREFISSNYKYRPLLDFKAKEVFKIKQGLSEKDLEIELHKLLSELEREVKGQEAKFLSKTFLSESKNIEANKKAYHDFLEKHNVLGKYKLAEYVVHRKVILDLLTAKTHLNPNSKYSLEKEIHDLFYPMGHDTNRAFLEQRNLWIIDEKLAYHQYLASDKAIRTYGDSDSGQRTDLTIIENDGFFDNRHAFATEASEHSSVILVEFKRPMRDEYTEAENPFVKARLYSTQIREGNAKDADGSYITLNKDAPFYCYIICDLTEKLRSWALDSNLTAYAHENGYFGYNPNWKIFFEVMSFKKLTADANKRNLILFDQLGLPKIKKI